jgi:hypothetical protein
MFNKFTASFLTILTITGSAYAQEAASPQALLTTAR